MAFIITWDEANPVDGTAAANIDNEIRNVKAAVGERLAGVFSDFRTATDRIHARKIFVDPANLEFRNDNDTTTLATLTNLGRFSSLLGRPAVFVGPNNAPGGGGGFVQFTTEVVDTDGFHDNAVNNTRLTIPTGLSGNYLYFVLALGTLVSDQPGTNAIALRIRKNSGADLYVNNYQFRDTNGGILAANSMNVIIPITVIQLANLVATDYLEVNLTRPVNGTDITAFHFGLLKLD